MQIRSFAQIRSFTRDLRPEGLLQGVDRRWLMLAGGAVLVLVLWGLSGRVLGATEHRTGAYQGASAVTVKTAQATQGAISASLSYTGDVKASSQVSVLPKGSGRIESLAVDVGSQVKKGDVLAQLDSGSLKAQLSQAQANLAAAQAKYDNMQAGSRPEQIAQAKANVDAANAKLAEMKAGGRDEQIAQAQAALDAAKAKQSTVMKGATDADKQAAQSALDAANAAVAAAKAKLDTVKQGPTQTEWGAALGAVDSARASMASAQAKLDDVKAGPKQADIEAAKASLVDAKAKLAAADDLKLYLDQPDSTRLSAGATSAEKVARQSAAAEAAVTAAQAKLDLLQSSPLPVDLAAAQAAYDAAKANVMAAEYRVDQMKRGATSDDIQQAQAAVDSASAQVASAQARLKQIQDGPTEEDQSQVNAAVTQAEQALALAQKPFRDEDIAQAQAALTVAQQQYALAQNPYTKFDMGMAQATVQQAQAAVDLAQIGLSEATVVSPIDGAVADKFQSVGALVSPANPIVSLISGDVEMVLGVEEGQIGQISEGQKAEITVAAYPGQVFPAKVSLIGPAADPKSRTFMVRVKPDANDGKLRAGMFAQVKIITQEKGGVTLVPKEAVVNRSGQTSVFVLKGDTVQMRPVKVGLSNATLVEIASGVVPAEEVVVAGQNDLRDGDKVKK